MSGLGLEAQRMAVAVHVSQTRATLLAEFTEVESGRKAQRPELAHFLRLRALRHSASRWNSLTHLQTGDRRAAILLRAPATDSWPP
jgi:hypothetical protein